MKVDGLKVLKVLGVCLTIGGMFVDKALSNKNLETTVDKAVEKRLKALGDGHGE